MHTPVRLVCRTASRSTTELRRRPRIRGPSAGSSTAPELITITAPFMERRCREQSRSSNRRLSTVSGRSGAVARGDLEAAPRTSRTIAPLRHILADDFGYERSDGCADTMILLHCACNRTGASYDLVGRAFFLDAG